MIATQKIVNAWQRCRWQIHWLETRVTNLSTTTTQTNTITMKFIPLHTSQLGKSNRENEKKIRMNGERIP